MTIDEIKAGRGLAVRISRTTWPGRDRVMGVSLPLDLLPRLLAGLHAIERAAIEEGDLLSEDYENEGLEPPQALRRAA